MKQIFFIRYFLIFIPYVLFSQNDSTTARFNFHFQQTIITQYHPKFNAPYSSINSLQPEEETQSSLTATMFFGARLWKGASFYFNPEIAGGSGFSAARGIAGFSNGETFRIGSPAPAIYLARAYYKQNFFLSKNYSVTDDGINQVEEKEADKQLTFIIGKFSVADFFDGNSFSHDPRTQFMNWSLMSTGAWDYPANTRGYTTGAIIQYASPKFECRFALTSVPTTANGPVLNYNYLQANANTIEFQYNYSKKGNVKLLGFYNNAPMGSYVKATAHNDTIDITTERSFGRSKYGASLNIEHNFTPNVGVFARASYNDGNNETWAFTEIDQSAHIGLSLKGAMWKRADDVFGIAAVINGISPQHQAYLKKGGYGFIIGDGNLNYANEFISEVYYLFLIKKWFLSISPGYQFILNPAYNASRSGPVHVFSLRAHLQF
ncbi:MAG: carbohydrate porin [Bacteroidetes bacterium]|nr:carbohydrate porin [Bacteroidota bacterium]